MPEVRTRRLFLALWPDAGIRRQIERQCRAWQLPAGRRLTDPDDWHLTLHFLGNIGEARVPDIASGAVVAIDRFEVILDQPRLWPRGMAVICASEVPPGLSCLHERLARRLQDLGEVVEPRPYQPHLTLARRAAGAPLPPDSDASIRWPVSSYVLVESTGRPDVRYRVIRSYR